MFPQFTLNVGIGTVGVTSIFFGLLDKIENGKVFLGLSFALRQGNMGAKNAGIVYHFFFFFFPGSLRLAGIRDSSLEGKHEFFLPRRIFFASEANPKMTHQLLPVLLLLF